MARLTPENAQKARDLIALYPQPRSALIPVLHIAQEQDGYLTGEAMTHVGELIGLTAAEVRGTATFYDMLFTDRVGKYLLSICTNIACLLNGGYELLEHVEQSLEVKAGGTTVDGIFTVEEVECIALCGNAPCLTANWRFFGDVTPAKFDSLVEDLRMGRLDDVVPPHGTLCRVRRSVGLVAAGAPAMARATAAVATASPTPASAPAAAPPDARAEDPAPEAANKDSGSQGPRVSVSGSDPEAGGPAPEQPAPPVTQPHGSQAPAEEADGVQPPSSPQASAADAPGGPAAGSGDPKPEPQPGPTDAPSGS